MLIHSVRLRNIRSYIDEEISFPEGTILLSGDIGSGKTTILLAIEFAIFGVMKGVVSGNLLLRHGSSSGSVELEFSVDDRRVKIRRSLKRTALGISQDSGFLIIEGTEFEGTPQELKSRILEILGYPESLLSKSKSLIFRHTVFTAQDEMKQILYEAKEERLDTLRRLFNIDKYKRIKENALNYSRDLKARVNYLEGRVESLPAKKKELEGHQALLGQLAERIVQLEKDHANSVSELYKADELLKLAEADFEAISRLERELDLANSELKSLEHQLERSSLELERLRKEVEEGLAGLGGLDPTKESEIKSRLEAKLLEIKQIQGQLSEIVRKKAENQAKKSGSEQILSQITSLDTCPVCLQKVSPEHIGQVKARENQIIGACTSNLSKLDQFEANFAQRQRAVEQEISNYNKDEREIAMTRLKFDVLAEKRKRRELLELDNAKLRESHASLKARATELSAKSAGVASKKELVLHQRQEMDRKRLAKSKVEQELAEKRARQDTLTKVAGTVEQEVKALALEAALLSQLREKRSWLAGDFIKVVDSIEASVMSRVYAEFSSFFQEWFGILVEDETLSARLDEYFTPVIDQNGYETTLDNLSGGEKTSVALAYRLALNKVINDFMTGIRTRDLIILDEPTEGFSTDQLDRVRAVLNQAKVRQTIIVSHEAKMESFVDSIVRIQKQNHVSKAV